MRATPCCEAKASIEISEVVDVSDPPSTTAVFTDAPVIVRYRNSEGVLSVEGVSNGIVRELLGAIVECVAVGGSVEYQRRVPRV